MRIVELFQSIQGEGQYAGTPSAFVRTSGCNLRCWFCDTPYASSKPEGEQLPWQTVLHQVEQFDCSHVVVTGGEPFLQRDVVPLTHALHERSHFITIETAGTVFRPVHADLMSISPKLSNSTPRSGKWVQRHEQLRDNREVVSHLLAHYRCQLKFVVDTKADLDEIQTYVADLPGATSKHVWLMPQATTLEELQPKQAWLQDEATRLGYHFSPRLQIELFGNHRGK